MIYNIWIHCVYLYTGSVDFFLSDVGKVEWTLLDHNINHVGQFLWEQDIGLHNNHRCTRGLQAEKSIGFVTGCPSSDTRHTHVSSSSFQIKQRSDE